MGTVRTGSTGRCLRAGLLIALGAPAFMSCGDGENTAPGGAGAGGKAGNPGSAGTFAGTTAGASGGAGGAEGGTDSGGSAGLSGSGPDGGGGERPDAGRGGSGTSGKGPTAGSSGESGGSGGSGGVVEPPKPPSCDEPTGDFPKLKLKTFVDVDEPVQLVAPPGDPRVFVVSRHGSIVVVRDGAVLDAPFLKLDVDAHYSELGLLGLAFHPNFAQNGLFYVHHIAAREADQDTGDLLVEEYAVDPDDPDRALPTARRELIRIPQPSHKHKAGSMAFDSQGLLYIALGNGGVRDLSTDESQLLGKVLRIAPTPEADGYAIPQTNPLLDGWAPEIVETGLRNPWRIAVDPCTDDLYIGDVGNTTAEEINVVRAGDHGRDFGFPAYEGTSRECGSCEVSGEEIEPLVAYTHDDGCAVIGGVVYRGSALPGLRGTYLYSDLCSGLFRSFRFDGSEAADERDLTLDLNPSGIDKISSFGTDASGEVYVMSVGKNRVYRIDPE